MTDGKKDDFWIVIAVVVFLVLGIWMRFEYEHWRARLVVQEMAKREGVR